MSFAFDPTDGYRNTTEFPTKPSSETAFRDSMQTLLDQLRDEINSGENSAAGITNISRQAIINGNFDVWQRGNTFTNSTNADFYTSDRWRVSQSNGGGTLPTVTESRQAVVPGDIFGALYFARIATNGAGASLGTSSNFIFEQPIENGTRYLCGNGKKITVSFWARSSIANKKIACNLVQEYGTGGSPSSSEQIVGNTVTLTSTWTKCSFTLTTNTIVGKTFGTNNDDVLRFRIWCMWGSSFTSRFNDSAAETFIGAGDIDIAQVQVNAGDVALPFQPRSFGEELARCQRYYYKSNESVGIVGSVSSVATGTFILTGGRPFPVTMRITPTFGLSQNGIQNQVRRQSDNVALSVTGNSFQGSNRGLSYVTFTGTPFTAGLGYDYDLAADAEF